MLSNQELKKKSIELQRESIQIKNQLKESVDPHIQLQVQKLEKQLQNICDQIQQKVVQEKEEGNKALQKAIDIKAKIHFKTALELLGSLPETQERFQKELEIQTLMGAIWIKTSGYTHVNVKNTFERVQALCTFLNDNEKNLEALRGLWTFYLVRADLAKAKQIAEELLHIAEKKQEPIFLIEANMMLGTIFCYKGEWKKAHPYLEKVISLYETQEDIFQQHFSMENPKIICESFLAISFWYRGYPVQALDLIKATVQYSEKLSQPYNSLLAFVHIGMIHLFRGESNSAYRYLTNAAKIGSQNQFEHWFYIATAMGGAALIEKGSIQLGLEQMVEALKHLRGAQAALALPLFLGQMAEGHLLLNQSQEAISVLNRALEITYKYHQEAYEAELWRIKGECFFLNGQLEEAKNSFTHALKIAQEQEIKSVELKILIGLVSLEKKMESASLIYQNSLEALYNWFQEGFETRDFETKDLKKAKEVLEKA